MTVLNYYKCRHLAFINIGAINTYTYNQACVQDTVQYRTVARINPHSTTPLWYLKDYTINVVAGRIYTASYDNNDIIFPLRPPEHAFNHIAIDTLAFSLPHTRIEYLLQDGQPDAPTIPNPVPLYIGPDPDNKIVILAGTIIPRSLIDYDPVTLYANITLPSYWTDYLATENPVHDNLIPITLHQLLAHPGSMILRVSEPIQETLIPVTKVARCDYIRGMDTDLPLISKTGEIIPYRSVDKLIIETLSDVDASHWLHYTL